MSLLNRAPRKMKLNCCLMQLHVDTHRATVVLDGGDMSDPESESEGED